MAELAAIEIPPLRRGLPSVSASLLASGQTPLHGAILTFLSSFIMGYRHKLALSLAFSALNSASYLTVTFCRHMGWSSSVPENDTLSAFLLVSQSSSTT